MKPLPKQFKWFYPGMKVKRWIALVIVGVLLFAAGSIFIIGKNLPRALYLFITRFISQGMLGIILFSAGAFFIYYGIKKLNLTFIKLFLPDGNEEKVLDLLYKETQLSKGIKIVGIGGGTGLHTLLRGLKEYTSNLTAVVTVSDDGGSSGRLRDEFNILPPGDIRQCLVALADSETAMVELFQSRFSGAGDLKGHSVGNLLLAAMTKIKGDFYVAIKELSKVLAIKGQVLPSTLQNVTLCAEIDDAKIITGESNISKKSSGHIKRIFLQPANVNALPDTLQSIREADIIVIGPGSLFTSIIPNLLVRDILVAIQHSKAIKIYVCNVMTQPGETDNFTAGLHLAKILEFIGAGNIDFAFFNSRYPERQLKKYTTSGSFPVVFLEKEIRQLGVKGIIVEDFIANDELLRHDPHKLANKIVSLYNKLRGY